MAKKAKKSSKKVNNAILAAVAIGYDSFSGRVFTGVSNGDSPRQQALDDLAIEHGGEHVEGGRLIITNVIEIKGKTTVPSAKKDQYKIETVTI